MKLTPLDIRKHEFSRSFRGYDPEEVRPFLEMISQQWEEVQDEVRHAQERVREMENKVAHYEKVEEALQEALEAARVNARRTQSHAEERARLILEDAELKAEQVMREAEQQRFKLRQDVSKLTHRHAEVTARLRHFLMSELEILAQHEEERPIGFMKLLPAREAESIPEEQKPRGRVAPAQEAPRAPAPEAEESDAPEQAREAFIRPLEPTPAPPEAEDTGTTYADMYARAAERARSQEGEHPQEPVAAEAPEEEEPAWTLRSLMGGESEAEPEEATSGERSEKEHIRRILEDLD